MVEPPVPLTALSEEQRAQALQRYNIIRPALEKGNISQAQVARTHSLLLAHRNSIVDQALSRKGTGWIGPCQTLVRQRESRRLPDRSITLVEGLALQTPPRSAAPFIARSAPLPMNKDGSLLVMIAVRQIIKNLDPALVTIAHEGPAAYREEFDLLYRRESPHANAMWQADHTLLPFCCSMKQVSLPSPGSPRSKMTTAA